MNTGAIKGETAVSKPAAPQQMVFARKASGLVRGLSVVDAFGVGFMNQGVTASMWIMISLGLSVFTGGNLIIATLLSALFCGIGFPLVWGILGGSMPRSGGEYIYNSRILHPLIGIAESFGNAFVWIMWIFVLAPMTVDPGLTMILQFLGAPAAWSEALTTTPVMFAAASIINLIGMLFVIFGIKYFARIQKVVMVVATIGGVAILLVLTFTNKETFISTWNNLAVQYGSLDYQGFINGARTAMGEAGLVLPKTWNWYDTLGVMVAGSWMFAYSYCITFIAGEVKRPDKTIILGNLFAVILPAVLMLWLGIVLYRAMDFEFLSATAWVDENGLAGYNLPWSSHFIGLAAGLVLKYKWLTALMALSFILFNIWYVALSYLAFPRILFAWGMDRYGPKWFTDINPKWATPVKNYFICFVIAEIGIALYSFFQERMAGLVVTGMEIVTVFGVTAIAAVLFPYRKKVRHIWEASPYKNWKFLGIPVVVIGGVVNIIYLAILFYFFVFMGFESITLFSLILFGAIWALGIAWYFYWKSKNAKVGIDASMTYGELPPD